MSVVIPHFERPELLRLAIDSVLRSGDAAVEIVVVDDRSSTQAWNRIQEFRNDSIAVLQRRDGARGPSRCRNLGVQASNGEYIIFLDSDDLMADWCVQQRLRYAAGAPAADFWVFPVLLFRDTPGDDPRLWGRMGDGDDAARFVHGAPPWHTSSLLWRKRAFTSIGGFNEKVLYGDDSDLHLRALVSGLRPHPFLTALPDVFVRRSTVPRITNSVTPELIDSRRVRLTEGARFLRSQSKGSAIHRGWEAQYFIEAEYILFNVEDAGKPIELVLKEWETEFSPSPWRRAKVRAYFRIALGCRRRAYLVLRAARRAAMRMLPATFFPSTADVAQPVASARTMARVRASVRNDR